MRRAVVVLVVLVLGAPLVAPVAARAQPAPAPPVAPTADALAAEAQDLAAAGKFVDAAAKFRAAYAIDARADLLCNVGVAYYKARDLPRAQLYLGQCLTRVGALDAGFAAQVRTVLGAVDDKLRAGEFAPVRITVVPDGASITVGGFAADDKLVGSQLIWLPYGEHTLAIAAEGYVTRSESVTIADHAEIARTVTLERAPVGGDDRALPRGTPAPRSRTPAIIATAATVAVGAGAVTAYLLARGKIADIRPDTGRPEYDALVDQARTRQHVAWALGGVAVVGAALTGYLWYRSSRPATRVEVAPTGDGGAAAWITGRF